MQPCEHQRYFAKLPVSEHDQLPALLGELRDVYTGLDNSGSESGQAAEPSPRAREDPAGRGSAAELQKAQEEARDLVPSQPGV